MLQRCSNQWTKAFGQLEEKLLSFFMGANFGKNGKRTGQLDRFDKKDQYQGRALLDS
jgi:hypothetical protein